MRNPLIRRLLNPGIYAALVVTAALVIAAYQVRPTYDIPFGTATDGPLLGGFNAGEVTQGESPLDFRWSTGDAYITLQDVGRQDFDVALTVSGSRPEGQPPPKISVSADDLSLLSVEPPPAITEYRFRVPREAVADGSLRLHLSADPFSPPGDPRELGVIVTRLAASPAATPDRVVEPPVGVLLSISLAAFVLGFLLSLLGWGVAGTALGASSVGVLASWLLVADRLWLTTARWYESWPGVLLAGGVLVAAVYGLGGWLLRRAGAPWTPLQRRGLLTMMLLVFGVRLAGQLHPQIFIVDLIFHAHRFETVQSGQLLFTIESAEWGGRSTFYLPTPYVLMLPLQWLLNNELLVIKLFIVGLSTLGAFLLFFLGRKALRDGRAGLIAASLYLTVPLAVLPFSWGITSNVFGEFFALCALAVMVAAWPRLAPRRAWFWLLAGTLLLALLSHPGVVQLTFVAFGLISILLLLARRRISSSRAAGWAVAALLLSFGTAYLIYYGHFAGDMLDTLQEIRAERAATAEPGSLNLRVGGSVADRSLGLVVRYAESRRDWLFGGLRGFWQEAHAYYRVWPVAAALLGYLLVWLSGRERSLPRRRKVFAVAAAGWLLAVLVYALIGWSVNLYVRYALFALPVVGLGAAIVLSALWRRGRAGALLASMMLVFFAAEALALWHYRITYAFK
jgi:hypothetical protein